MYVRTILPAILMFEFIPVRTDLWVYLQIRKLRAMRTEAHRYFNQIYYRNIMSKREAYEWLSEILGLPISKTHIGQMGEYYCQLVIDESKKLLNGEKQIRNLRNQKYRRLGECG